MTTPAVQVTGLRKSYGDTIAVDDVSFEAAPGEILGILGPNGAGKTTTVESVAGLRVGDSGSVRVLDIDPWTDREPLTRVLGVQLLEAGATGYLLKDSPASVIFDAVRATAGGETVLSPAVASHLARHVHSPEAEQALSAREREVLVLVARGLSNRLIADEPFVSEATVKTHLQHLFAKLGVNDRAAAVAVGYERGVLG